MLSQKRAGQAYLFLSVTRYNNDCEEEPNLLALTEATGRLRLMVAGRPWQSGGASAFARRNNGLHEKWMDL